jgi:hypothetical protein
MRTRTISRLHPGKGYLDRLRQQDIITVCGGSSHSEYRVNWLIKAGELSPNSRGDAPFDFVSLNSSADYTTGNYGKSRVFGRQKMKGEKG